MHFDELNFSHVCSRMWVNFGHQLSVPSPIDAFTTNPETRWRRGERITVTPLTTSDFQSPLSQAQHASFASPRPIPRTWECTNKFVPIVGQNTNKFFPHCFRSPLFWQINIPINLRLATRLKSTNFNRPAQNHLPPCMVTMRPLPQHAYCHTTTPTRPLPQCREYVQAFPHLLLQWGLKAYYEALRHTTTTTITTTMRPLPQCREHVPHLLQSSRRSSLFLWK
jgi:hypothetical protein